MNTPIFDFVRANAAKAPVRLHMPGHKGRRFLGMEGWDITEIAGADELYVADGIIGESEQNAGALFGSRKTLYSTEGSSQCIRAMVYLAATAKGGAGRKTILAARNAHKAFLFATALCDLDVTWVMPAASDSLCSCPITAADVEQALNSAKTPPVAVYITTPDYLGGLLPVREISEVCHRHGVPLLVDNAHGAYLKFLPESLHPMDAGADLCCDSAHKTLPVLTGGAYLHIGKNAPERMAENAKTAMALFGSTSPSYLTLSSLDFCNRYLAGEFRAKLQKGVERVEKTRVLLAENGWQVRIKNTEPMKLTLVAPEKTSGTGLAELLRRGNIECEYADAEHLVLMPSAETKNTELQKLVTVLGQNKEMPRTPFRFSLSPARVALSVREAIFSPSETVSTEAALGRICAAPTVSCPPAIPIAVSGEIFDRERISLLEHYGIRTVSVVAEEPLLSGTPEAVN